MKVLLIAMMLLGTLGARLKLVEKAEAPPAAVNAVSKQEQDFQGLQDEFAALDATAPSAEEREEAGEQAAQAVKDLHSLHESMVDATKAMKAKIRRASQEQMSSSEVRKRRPSRARRTSKERLTQLYHADATEEVRHEDSPEFQHFLAAEAELWRLVEERATLKAEAEACQDDIEKAKIMEVATFKASEIGILGRAIRKVLHYWNKKRGLLDEVLIEDMIKAAAGDDWEAEAIAQDGGKPLPKTEAQGEASPEVKAATGLLPVEDMMDPETEIEEKIEDEIEDMIEADMRAAGKNMLNTAAGEDYEEHSNEEHSNDEDEAESEDASNFEPSSREESMQFEHSNMIASEIEQMLDADTGGDFGHHDAGHGIQRSATNDDYFEELTQNLAKKTAKADETAEDDAAMAAEVAELALKD